ncbi:hypothetical protein EUTSA_v10009599mg [Eutrema salsugineum]|uniref:DUF4378 domain-containing protein n=1 Tax=Eutrema salsugineum TaxID=72664 RepID=V4KZK3_EUTSA|nr:hypothetical protein EUTSA_v10009599mg [Eutrema salsugineum]
MPIEKHGEEKLCSKIRERSVRLWISGFFKRKKKRSPQESSEDSRLMRRRNRANNLYLLLSEIMGKLKYSFKKEKPQHDKRFLGKKRRFQRSLSTKDHLFLERMTSMSQKRSHHDNEKHLPEMPNNGDFNQNLGTSKQFQRRIVSLPEYLSPFSCPGITWDQNSTELSRSASDDFIKSETFSDDFITCIKEIETASSGEGCSPSISKSNHIVDILTFEISQTEPYDGEKEGEILKEAKSLPQLSLLSVAAPSHDISKTEEYKLVLEPLFIEYEISPARGEAKRQPLCDKFQEKNHPRDEKETVFKYVKAVLDAIDSSWEEMYLRTEFSDQILSPALISNIPFYPSQLCVDHELLFDCINELLFEFCRFPQWASFVFSFTVESIVHEVQKEVYCRLFSSQSAHSLDQILREDMAKPRNWLDIRCDLECIAFETGDLILKELLEELMLDL